VDEGGKITTWFSGGFILLVPWQRKLKEVPVMIKNLDRFVKHSTNMTTSWRRLFPRPKHDKHVMGSLPVLVVLPAQNIACMIAVLDAVMREGRVEEGRTPILHVHMSTLFRSLCKT
jgi:hypothetical protein